MSRRIISIPVTTGALRCDTSSTRSSFLLLAPTIKRTSRFAEVWSDWNLRNRERQQQAEVNRRESSRRLLSRFVDFCVALSSSRAMQERRSHAGMIFSERGSPDRLIPSMASYLQNGNTG